MSRPRQYGDRTSLSVRLDTDLYQRLQKEADSRMVSTNLLVSRAIAEFLDRLVPVDEAIQLREAGGEQP